jgi:hypothetical protein
MPDIGTNTENSKRTQDMIFGTAVFLGAVLLFMLIYHSTRGTTEAVKPAVEPPLSADHEETLYVGNNISAEEREETVRKREEAKAELPYGETKWGRKAPKREENKKDSTYEQDEKVVKPEKTGGAL